MTSILSTYKFLYFSVPESSTSDTFAVINCSLVSTCLPTLSMELILKVLVLSPVTEDSFFVFVYLTVLFAKNDASCVGFKCSNFI